MKTFKIAVAAMMLLTAMFFAAGCRPDNNEGINEFNGHGYLDLGLPSGTLWATCNVGSSIADNRGDYFAWAETEPKELYSWATYKYCNGFCHLLTKYCYQSSYGNDGFTDNLTELLPEDDVATVKWGDGWSVPTKAQWEELFQNTTRTWMTQNGIEGCLFSADNGYGVFLPAAGVWYEDNPHDFGVFGDYWVKSLVTDDLQPFLDGETGETREAWYVFFNADTCLIDHDYRFTGMSIRPVHSPK